MSVLLSVTAVNRKAMPTREESHAIQVSLIMWDPSRQPIILLQQMNGSGYSESIIGE